MTYKKSCHLTRGRVRAMVSWSGRIIGGGGSRGIDRIRGGTSNDKMIGSNIAIGNRRAIKITLNQQSRNLITLSHITLKKTKSNNCDMDRQLGKKLKNIKRFTKELESPEDLIEEKLFQPNLLPGQQLAININRLVREKLHTPEVLDQYGERAFALSAQLKAKDISLILNSFAKANYSPKIDFTKLEIEMAQERRDHKLKSLSGMGMTEEEIEQKMREDCNHGAKNKPETYDQQIREMEAREEMRAELNAEKWAKEEKIKKEQEQKVQRRSEEETLGAEEVGGEQVQEESQARSPETDFLSAEEFRALPVKEKMAWLKQKKRQQQREVNVDLTKVDTNAIASGIRNGIGSRKSSVGSVLTESETDNSHAKAVGSKDAPLSSPEDEHNLFLKLVPRLKVKLHKYKPQDLALVCNCYARFFSNQPHKQVFNLFRRLSAEMPHKLPFFEFQHLAMVISSYANLGVKDDMLISDILEELSKRDESEYTVIGIIMFVNAVSKIQSGNVARMQANPGSSTSSGYYSASSSAMTSTFVSSDTLDKFWKTSSEFLIRNRSDFETARDVQRVLNGFSKVQGVDDGGAVTRIFEVFSKFLLEERGYEHLLDGMNLEDCCLLLNAIRRYENNMKKSYNNFVAEEHREQNPNVRKLTSYLRAKLAKPNNKDLQKLFTPEICTGVSNFYANACISGIAENATVQIDPIEFLNLLERKLELSPNFFSEFKSIESLTQVLHNLGKIRNSIVKAEALRLQTREDSLKDSVDFEHRRMVQETNTTNKMPIPNKDIIRPSKLGAKCLKQIIVNERSSERQRNGRKLSTPSLIGLLEGMVALRVHSNLLMHLVKKKMINTPKEEYTCVDCLRLLRAIGGLMRNVAEKQSGSDSINSMYNPMIEHLKSSIRCNHDHIPNKLKNKLKELLVLMGEMDQVMETALKHQVEDDERHLQEVKINRNDRVGTMEQPSSMDNPSDYQTDMEATLVEDNTPKQMDVDQAFIEQLKAENPALMRTRKGRKILADAKRRLAMESGEEAPSGERVSRSSQETEIPDSYRHSLDSRLEEWESQCRKRSDGDSLGEMIERVSDKEKKREEEMRNEGEFQRTGDRDLSGRNFTQSDFEGNLESDFEGNYMEETTPWRKPVSRRSRRRTM